MTPQRYVLLRIPKTASTWMDEATRRLDVLALRREPLRGALRIDTLGRRTAAVPGSGNYPWSVYGRYQYDRLIQRTMKGINMAVPGPDREKFRNFLRETTGRVKKHASWRGLPEWMREFPVISVLRDVLSWHLSHWLYITAFPGQSGFWWDGKLTVRSSRVRHWAEQWLNGDLSRSSWERLSAEGYWNLMRDLEIPKTLSFPGPHLKWPGIGIYTVRIVRMIHRDPHSVLCLSEAEMEEYFASGRWRDDICPGWFLRQERLVEDMRRVLVGEVGYRQEDLEQVLAGMPERLNEAEVGRKERARQELYGNGALCKEILHAERFAHRYIVPGLTEEVSTVAAPPPRSLSSSGYGA